MAETAAEASEPNPNGVQEDSLPAFNESDNFRVDDEGQNNGPGEEIRNTRGPIASAHSAAASPGYSAYERGASGVQCRFLPHGIYALIPAAFSTLAWLSSLSQDGCDYARLTGPIVADLTNNPEVPFLDVGFNQYRTPTQNSVDGSWSVNYRLACQDYNTDVVEMDGYWKFSKGVAFLSLVFGGGGALFLWFSSCFVFSRGTWRWAGYELLAATIFQAFAFLWFKTDLCNGNDGQDSCSLFYGSKADILASFFWFASVLAIFLRYPRATAKSMQGANARNAHHPPSSNVELAGRSPSVTDLSSEDQVTPAPTSGIDSTAPPVTAAEEHEII